ncbi:MAG: hemerythrin domain-containing protein [Candidatus Omnitrophica bacterium]|nr:hemerythrin domain-containing protein [Candidatus Omnitrophota bacterium]
MRHAAPSSMAWVEIVRADQERLRAQAADLRDALAVTGVAPGARRGAVAWIVHQLAPALETHLQQQEEVLLPVLERLVGRHAGVLALVRAEYQALRETAACLQAQVEGPGDLGAVVQLLMDLLADHEVKTERLVVDILSYTLTSGAQDALAEALAAHGEPDQRQETNVSVPLVRAVA